MEPTQQQIEQKMQSLARVIAGSIPQGCGFALLVFAFEGPEASYVSNANRSDMIRALRECADRLEARQDHETMPGGS